jgi:hypothetical protein
MPEAQSLPPVRPVLLDQPSRFLLLERAVEDEYRPRMREELQRRVSDLAETTRAESPVCVCCGRLMVCQDVRPVSWVARFWTIAGRRAALPLPELRVGEPPSSGFTRCGTGPY